MVLYILAFTVSTSLARSLLNDHFALETALRVHISSTVSGSTSVFPEVGCYASSIMSPRGTLARKAPSPVLLHCKSVFCTPSMGSSIPVSSVLGCLSVTGTQVWQHVNRIRDMSRRQISDPNPASKAQGFTFSFM